MAWGVMIVVGLVAAGCGGETNNASSSDAKPAITATTAGEDGAGPTVVEMTDGLQFTPQVLTITVGETVEFRNVGDVAHTVTTTTENASDPKHASVPAGVKPWDSGFIFGGGKSYRRTFDEPGTYHYFCIPHEGAQMIGTIIVKS